MVSEVDIAEIVAFGRREGIHGENWANLFTQDRIGQLNRIAPEARLRYLNDLVSNNLNQVALRPEARLIGQRRAPNTEAGDYQLQTTGTSTELQFLLNDSLHPPRIVFLDGALGSTRVLEAKLAGATEQLWAVSRYNPASPRRFRVSSETSRPVKGILRAMLR